jgi:Domain of unknown function (DUF4129)
MSCSPAAAICDSAPVHADDGASGRTGGPTGLLAGALAGLAALLVVVLAVLGARSGPWVPPTPSAAAAPTTVAGPPALPKPKLPAQVTAAAAPTPSPTVEDGAVLTWVLVGGVLLLVVAGVVVLATGLLHRPGWRRGLPLEGAPVEAREQPGTALPGAVERALDAVEDPDAREAVVQAWLLLGRAAAETGTAPRAAETAAEYARRLAAERGLPAGAVAALAELYREARFSTHEVRPEQRDRAREHLLALRAALGSGAPR